MKKLILTTATLALGALTAHAEEVRVYNWSDYIDEALLEKFEQETGLDLIYDVFDSNEVLETKMLAGGSGYDVVVPSGTFLQRQITAGAFQKLDMSKLPNHENMWDVIEARTDQYDPDNAYSINYMWGTTGLRRECRQGDRDPGRRRADEQHGTDLEPGTWRSCRPNAASISWMHPTEIIPMTLKYLGEDPDSQRPGCSCQGRTDPDGGAPYIKKFHSSEYINALANGDICVACRLVRRRVCRLAIARTKPITVSKSPITPFAEGSLMWFDQMAIPGGRPQPGGRA